MASSIRKIKFRQFFFGVENKTSTADSLRNKNIDDLLCPKIKCLHFFGMKNKTSTASSAPPKKSLASSVATANQIYLIWKTLQSIRKSTKNASALQ